MVKAQSRPGENLVIRYASLVVVIVPLLLYIGSLRLGFVYFDDDILVLGNYEKISNLANIGKAFRTDVFFASLSPYYRPLQNVSLMLDAAIGGKSPMVYHATNVAVHILTCVGLFWFLGLLGFGKAKSLAATLVFSVHPMMGQAVLWIPARGDLLVTLFTVTSCGLLLKYLQVGKVKFLVLHSLMFAGALFSKESGVLLPLLFLGLILIRKEKLFGRKTVYALAAWIPVLAGWYFLREISIDHRGDSQVGLHAIAANLPFIPEIIARLFVPFNLPVTPVFSPVVTSTGILLLVLVAGFSMARVNRDHLPLVLIGIAWFLAFALPNMFVRLSSANDNFEYLNHRAYLPAIGFLIVMISLVPDRWFEKPGRTIMYITGGITLLFFLLSFIQQQRYSDGVRFWRSAIAYRPDKAWFRYYMGRYYFKQNDNQTYERYLLEAESIKSYGEFKYQLGMINFADRKEYDRAYAYFSDAFRQGYSDPEGKANFIALCLESSADMYRRGDFSGAVRRCREAVDNDPSNADAVYNLGIYLVNSGRKQEAAAMWLRALRLKPDLQAAYRSLSLYYRYDAKKADSADWYAREYEKHGGTGSQISPGKQ